MNVASALRAPTAVAAAVIGLACTAPEAPQENTGTVEQAVNMGILLDDNSFNAVWRLAAPGVACAPPGAGCTAEVITTQHALTAAHCLGKPDPDVNRDFVFCRGFDQSGEPLGSATHSFHTMMTSGSAEVLGPAPEQTSDDRRGGDIALIKLDAPVNRALIAPLHPPIGAGECGNDFEGHLIGFGENLCDEGLAKKGKRQKSQLIDDWTRSELDDGDDNETFEDGWAVLVPGPGATICCAHTSRSSSGCRLRGRPRWWLTSAM